MISRMTIEEVLAFEEKQIFDRKSINIAATALSDTICAFANADGGTIAIGISDKTRTIEGVDFETNKLNDLLRAPMDYCNPSVQVSTDLVPCMDSRGQKNHVLLMHIDASMHMHTNHADEVFLRVGDRTKKLTFEDRITLMYDKGMRFYEDSPVADANLDDINYDFLKEYLDRIDYGKEPIEYLLENKNFAKKKDEKIQLSTAAILLFGKNPQLYFPRARIRFIRYEGVEEKFGAEMNVVKDVVFEGRILQQVQDAIAYIKTQIKEKTYLGPDGLFKTEEEYPEFVRTEIVVNAVTHRDYSIRGTDIQIKMFDNHLVVESPGKLPGLVKASNIRKTHFSRNPIIADFMKNYKYVKEYGEGVDRMYKEMEKVSLPEPIYRNREFMLDAIIYNSAEDKNEKEAVASDDERFKRKKETFGEKKERLGHEKKMVDEKKRLFDIITDAENDNEISRIIAENLREIINDFEISQVIGRKELREELGYGESKAGRMIETLEKLDLIQVVTGKGKGKYIFKQF